MIGLYLGPGFSSKLSKQTMPSPVPFNPSSLFDDGSQGVFFDPNPVTTGAAINTGVSNLADRSGRANDAAQPSPGSQPVLRSDGGRFYLEFDGTNDSMATAAFDMGPSDTVTVILGLRKLADTPAGLVVEFSTNAFTNAGAFYVAAPEATGGASDYRFYARGNASPPAAVVSGPFIAPDTCVLTCRATISTNNRSLRRNGEQLASSSLAMGGGSYRNYPLFLGGRAGTSLRFNGRLYGLVVINRSLTSAELSSAEAWMANRAGATL